MTHSYPRELALILNEQWDHVPAAGSGEPAGQVCATDRLPDLPDLEFLLSACYQASLMRDEGRPVTFRLLLRDPSRIEAHDGPPAGLHRILFSGPRIFDEHELRRLSSAADFNRSLIGVSLTAGNELRIWGLVNSGSRWLQAVRGGRKVCGLLPPSLVIRVSGPGRLAVCKGSVAVAILNAGRIACPTLDAPVPPWLVARFAPADHGVPARYRPGLEAAERPLAMFDKAFLMTLSQQVYKRILSMMRSFQHGGTIILIPPERAAELSERNPYLDIRYRFVDEEPRYRLGSLYVQLLSTLVEEGLERDRGNRPIGWGDYVASESSAIERLDEAIFEAAHFIADLTTMDGAVVMTKSLELLGFGAEILGGSQTIDTVARVTDARGEERQIESTHRVGTRHGSAYRLCQELHDAVAVVASQDGLVRIVFWKDDMVAYWDQVAVSVLDL